MIKEDGNVREYKVGESCWPENCFSSCARKGRSHYHIKECKSLATCDGKVNPYRAGVMEVFERAATLCTDSGSTHVRQQMMRDEKNIVGSKTFRLVKPKSHDRYATNVANFVYYCNKAPWDEGGKRTFATVQDCLLHVLTEEHKSISQTFITR